MMKKPLTGHWIMSFGVVMIVFTPLLYPSFIGQEIHIHHQSILIGRIEADRVADGSITVPVIFDLVRTDLETKHLFILSRHFQIQCNDQIITRNNSNFDILKLVDSTDGLHLEVIYPDHITWNRNPYFSTSRNPPCFHDVQLTSFIVTDTVRPG